MDLQKCVTIGRISLHNIPRLGSVSFKFDDLLVVRLYKPLSFIRYIALKENDGQYLYYNSCGDVSETRARALLIPVHKTTSAHRYRLYNSHPEVSHLFTLIDPPKEEYTPTRMKKAEPYKYKIIRNKMKRRLQSEYERRKALHQESMDSRV